MRQIVLAIGRATDPALKTLWDTYARRLRPPLELRELEDRKRAAAGELKAREAKLLLDALPDGALLVALDERGKTLGSADFARQIGRWRDQGTATLGFAIGGADGLDRAVLDRAVLVLSLGAMTWPHQLARVMLAEQLYRADTILAGHPYHRA